MDISFRRNCAAFATDFEKIPERTKEHLISLCNGIIPASFILCYVLFRFFYAQITLISYRRLAFDPFSTSSSFFLLISQLNACPIGNTTVDRFMTTMPQHHINSLQLCFSRRYPVLKVAILPKALCRLVSLSVSSKCPPCPPALVCRFMSVH